ncbi:MAG: transcriptional regulator [Acidobacteria bacterium]|nr:MAG: transcriptional regulator [Acidobacteriota bacterium]
MASLTSKPKLRFPFLDLAAQFANIREEVMDAVSRVLQAQQFILGPEVEKFETDVSTYVGSTDAVACASGSDALLLALMVHGLQAGDEVITTPFTFIATAAVPAHLGVRPVFVDIKADTYNIDVEQIEAAVSPRTRAIIPVHLFGLPADMKPLIELAARRDLKVIEDAAQAIGAEYAKQKVGTFGSIGCFSFFPSKNLGCAGDGGLVTTNDAGIAAVLRRLRNHGSTQKYYYERLGVNSRLDALQAAILRVKLKYLPQWTAARRHNAEYYRALIAQHGLQSYISPPSEPANCTHVYNQFTIRARTRDELRAFLTEEGIPTEVYYPSPLHLQAAFAYLGYKPGQFPEAERASREVLALPIYPEITRNQQELVVQSMASFYKQHAPDAGS